MPTLTMTPCYSIILCFLAVVLIVIIAAPIVIILMRRAWEMMNAAYAKIKKPKG